ncbi:TIGR01777 family oxidoreductase [Aeromicrobium panaciterrae]|uniref:TIGR01777 family oxidoreductase n=1 Tax=Aeromicrobium panaciterrae TaxID=363861 RepID=UPI0031D00705
MQVVIGGASGFLGTALTDHLRSEGHTVTRLVRSGTGDDASRWDPAAGVIDQHVIDSADVVVNLSGASISRWPRTRAYKQELLDSRTSPTGTLAQAIAKSPTPPALLSGSAMGFYGGDRGDEVLTESSRGGTGFLADIVQAWEAAAAPAVETTRVAFLRTSLVLDKSGGILKLMQVPFKLGGGAKLGPGTQYMSVISLQDWLRAVTYIAASPTASGPFNLTTPSSQTNADLTDELGRALHRPTFLTAPSFALKAALGTSIASDLLGSLRLSPAALTRAGFTFEHPDLRSTLEAGL